MSRNTFKDLADSKSVVESVRHLRPSSLFIVLLVVAVSLSIKFLFNDVAGYDYMVWIWFIMTIVAMGVATYSYSIDMAAFAKRNNYEKQKK